MKRKTAMKTAIVAGGTGFLGSNLCIALVKSGRRVISVDNNYTGRDENVAEIAGSANFRSVLHDITEPFDPGEKIDEIYNLACPASPPHYQGGHAIATTKTCVIGSINMLELAKKHGARILFSSTSEVYGDPDVHPQREDYRGSVNPIGIRACYDEGKRCAESLFFDYHRNEGVRIKVARIFNTYGPKMRPDDGRVVSNFILQAIKGEDLTIYGDGRQTRSFCYVDDMTGGIVRLMESREEFTGPVNLGNPGEFTMLELADAVIAKTGGKSKISFCPLPQDDPKKRRPDIGLARSELGWEPRVALPAGLDKTIEYFRKILGSKQ